MTDVELTWEETEALCFCDRVHDCLTTEDSDRLRAACEQNRAAVEAIVAARLAAVRAEVWEEGRKAGATHERALWYWQAGNRAAMAAAGMPVGRPVRPENPYRTALDGQAPTPEKWQCPVCFDIAASPEAHGGHDEAPTPEEGKA